MDNNQETTRTCTQCHKEIALINFSLHETHCSRFLCLCPDCNEAVPRDQLSEHRKEQHSKVRCCKCHQKMEQCQLQDHETDECIERLQICEYCDLEMPWKELKQHCLACGSRTELCKDCNTYVKLSDRVTHLSTCSGADSYSSPADAQSAAVKEGEGTETGIKPPVTQPARKEKHENQLQHGPSSGLGANQKAESKKEVGNQDIPGQQSPNSFREVRQAASLTDRTFTDHWRDGGDPDHIFPCPHCHLALPFNILRRHEAKCKIYNFLNRREKKEHAAAQSVSQQ
ncbi:TRAF-type zinc finger domain-containing protein 1-like isoform X1 [Cynoglossus semilaevis]|uniref:TRAF-type zinc finger domain-containing protein 1-like n=1 Tax=Cynoglossus semilaevis TaxID=244447 RepID=A0A3P8V6E3_CYNSE|nr:TRAF-type zinc finger domain-containing protein 1-like isoform X1 [Cynoglossus semilaevis]